ncbi:thyroid receptor-interacting protein 11 isoform X1 [Helicoverpa armigera]|uniref:thyroid receptor-interacting protein 11 isoform X1 n=2 Tax=Helicoverpa armigera TaxID=29058 RepID=UPI003083B4C2
MSWLNLNNSLNSLKGQLTNFASEVLSESPAQDIADESLQEDSSVKELEEKCRNQELEIASLKKSVEQLQSSLQSEKLSRKNGVKEEESSWYWDPPPQTSKISEHDHERNYRKQLRESQDDNLRERDTIDLRPDNEVERLREENRKLTSNLEDLDSQHQQAMEKLLTLKRELQSNFEVLKQEHEDLKTTNEEYAAQNKKLLATIDDREKELDSAKAIKADYDTLQHKYQNLERIHGLLRENAEKFQEENQELHEEVFKLQEQVTKLEHEIEVANKRLDVSDMVPRETYEELLKEINELKDRRNSNQIHLDEINIDDNAKGVIETLKRDISELKHKLAQKESSCQETVDNKTIKPEKIMQLYNKYVNFELPIDYVGEIPSAGDNIVLFKLESAFKTLHSFKKEIDVLEHQLSEQKLNSNHLQTQIDDITTENDFLTTDIQHLERELNEMKKNNDFLISEIANLKNTSKLEPIIETHEDNLAKLETELADTNKLNKIFEAEIQRILRELDEVRTEKTKLRDSMHELKQKYTTMMDEFEMFKNQSNAVAELEMTVNNKDHENIKKSVDEIDDLKKRLNASNAKNEQLSIDIHILENDKVLLTKKVDDLKVALDEKSYAHKELETLKATLDHKLHDFETKLDDVIKHKQEVESDKHSLQEKVAHLENQLTNASTSGEEKLAHMSTEKSILAEKLQQVSKENETLAESIDVLKKAIAELQQKERELLTENTNLKRDIISGKESKVHEETSNGQRTETIHQDILSLKEENKKLHERKMALEAELSATDSKIVHLEDEFDKLIGDLGEKDSLIDGLNSTVQQNKITIDTLNASVADLEKSAATKNEEILRLRHSVEQLTLNLSDTSLMANRDQEEFNRLHDEKDELHKQIFSLNDEINLKNNKISTLTWRLEEYEKFCEEYKAKISVMEKEAKELTQQILELKGNEATLENITHNEHYIKLLQQKESIETEVAHLQSALTAKEKEIEEAKFNYAQLEKMAAEYKSIIDSTLAEKTELINLINLKHNESIQYHNEIQRLNHVILEQTSEFKKAIEEKDRLVQNSGNCTNCENLRVTLKEKDGIIISLNQVKTDYDKVMADLLTANETVKNLSEKCDKLEKNLAVQLETARKLSAEKSQLSEQEQNSVKELERLRRHLVETEDNYTQELMVSEQKLTECQARLHQVEERAKQNSTVYTSNSIRANQEVETYRNQIKLLEKQREDVQARLGDAEDARSRSEAALTNLQVVLEQFQLEKEREIHTATEKIRNKLEEVRRENIGLQAEISRLNLKLEEALAGLQAASRLGDQVETKRAEINDLKEQVRTLQTSVAAAEERYYNAISNQQDKVDKNLVKNLVINYVMTAGGNSTNKTQVLRVLSTVLDFNQSECERLGLARSSAAPDSLAAEFVKFLQNESKPRAQLPNMMTLAQSTGSRSNTPSSRKNSAIGPPPIAAIPKSTHSRNPSTSSSNLLFQNIDSIETASQLSRESDREPRVLTQSLDTGVNQTRNTEGAILKSVLKDM